MINLKAIRVFLSVARHRSFSAAANELNLAPASATRIVAQLEQDLDQQVFVRTTRQVGLTAFGSEVAARYSPIVDGFDDVTQTLLRQSRPAHGHLRITAPVSLGLKVMPDLLSGFALAYPNVTVDVNFTDALVDVIAERCDVAVRVSRPPKDQSTIWRKIAEVPRFAVASPSFAGRLGPIEGPADLPEDHMMSYGDTGEAEVWAFEKNGKTRTVRAGSRIMSNNGDFLCAMACRGHGITALPDFIVRDALQSDALVRVIPDWTVASLWLTLSYPPYAQLPPIVGYFTEYFESFIADYKLNSTH